MTLNWNNEIIIYEGGITRYRGLFQMSQAVEIIKKEKPSVKLLLVGRFADKEFRREMEAYISSHNLDENIEFTGSVNHELIPQYIRLAKVGLIILHPVPNNFIGTPIKQFEYMACGVPIVASDFPMLRKFVGGAEAGLLINPMNYEEIAQAVLRLLNQPETAKRMGENGLKAVTEKYNWGNMEKVLLDIYARL